MSNRTASNLLTPTTRSAAATLLDLARQQYENRPDATAVTLIAANTPEPQHVTVREFFDGAGRYAEALRDVQVAPRDLVILVMDHSEALLNAFWGALMLGAVPSIFPFLSDKLDPTMYFERVKELVTHSGAVAVIASEAFSEPLSALLADGGVRVVSSTDLNPTATKVSFAAGVSGTDIAFLQHSSGTTGLQKGVALTHEAVLNQLASYASAIRLAADDRIAS